MEWLDISGDGFDVGAGRVDDVINVSGHRIGTAEVESALVNHPACAEAAVVPVEHPIKGQGIYAFITLMEVSYALSCSFCAFKTIVKACFLLLLLALSRGLRACLRLRAAQPFCASAWPGQCTGHLRR